jgi:hypothetical protein
VDHAMRVSPEAKSPGLFIGSRGFKLSTTCVQNSGFEGLENAPKQRRINNRLLSYTPTYNYMILMDFSEDDYLLPLIGAFAKELQFDAA